MKNDARPLFLVGFMGSGKSATGRRIAELTGREFLDTDRSISEAEGKSIDVIFTESGEERFRAMEWELLQQLAGRQDLVVATGGGLYLRHAAREWLRRQGSAVWLDVPLSIVRERLGQRSDRPLWNPGDPVALRALFDRRRAVYALADFRVDGSPGDPDAVARRILKRMVRIFG